MNPLKADKIQFGSSANMPNITRGTGSTLDFFDPNVGTISLSSLISERGIAGVVTVSTASIGSDFTSIQSAIDTLPETGGVVVVYEGTYSEALEVTKPITLIGRGEVVVTATDASVVMITNTRASFENIYFKVLTNLGNNSPSIITATTTDISHQVILEGCTLDTSSHPTANFVSSSLNQLISLNTLFVGAGKIDCSQSMGFKLVGTECPDTELSQMVSVSLISGVTTGEVTLVGSELVIEGKFVSCIGDLNSTLWVRNLTGTIDLVNEDRADIEFPCPISEADYNIMFENPASGEVPVVTARNATGFSISLGAPVTETLRWSIAL